MESKSTLSRHEYEDYLVFLYFGKLDDPLISCINRAYLDFNRTLRGYAKRTNNALAHDQAVSFLKEKMEAAKAQAEQYEQTQFDLWHQNTCQLLIDLYRQSGFPDFTVGQAQKWLNMTFKYVFTLGDDRVPGFTPIYQFCHVPLDSILIQRLAPYGFRQFSEPAWSKINQYGEYLDRQKWIRKTFEDIPLDLESRLWMDSDWKPRLAKANIKFDRV